MTMEAETKQKTPDYSIPNGKFTIEGYTGEAGMPMRYGKLTNNTPNTGKTLLFVPGLGGSVKAAIPFLSHLLPYYDEILGCDLRSFGLNPVESPIFTADWHLKDIHHFFEATGILKRPHLDVFGISLGGALATLIEKAHHKHFRHLMLMSPAYKSVNATFPLSYQIKNILGRLLQGKSHTIRLPYGLKELTQNPAVLNDPHHQTAPEVPLTIDYLLSVKALTQSAYKHTCKINTPTMILVPELDVICDPTAMKQGYNNIPDSTPKSLNIYPDLFHDILLETQHPQVAQEVIQWLGYS